jgi:hypothetical protein
VVVAAGLTVVVAAGLTVVVAAGLTVVGARPGARATAPAPTSAGWSTPEGHAPRPRATDHTQ